MAKHIPNILTVTRFFLIPFIIYFIVVDNYPIALIFLILSGLTDVLDGFIARKFNFITNFGKLIDPLADKSTQIAVLLTLAFKNIIPFWIIIVVVIKEAAMIAGASFLYGKELVVSSRWFGKLSTVLFYVAIACSFGIKYWNTISATPENSVAPLPQFDLWIYYLALATTIFSLVAYYITFYKQGYLKKENLKIEDTNQK
ncbi:MAG: CDP-diacylglycerol--glycerol-3-phosphate 3-phosphatidyltransferase [Clostridia bacterium]|nr:CDP-diacylglycerol--glycerol-3-phosphate 3-phosphatidyltransferase [Clostridia bacterium]